MGGAVLPPWSLAWGRVCSLYGGVMVTSSTRTCASTQLLPGLLLSIPLTLWQATVGPCLCWRLPNTHREAWLSLLWGHCSFLLGPGAHMVLSFPSKSLFPQSCGSFIIKSHWHSKSDSLETPSPFARSQVWKPVVGPRTFAIAWELLWRNYSPVCGSSVRQLCSGANGGLLQEDLFHLLCLPALLLPVFLSLWEATADPCLCRRPSHTQRQVWLSLLWGSLLLSVGFGAHKILFMPSKSLWQVWGLILNVIAPLLPSCCFSFVLGCGVAFLGGSNILFLMVIQQLVVILVFSQEKMGTHPSTPPN